MKINAYVDYIQIDYENKTININIRKDGILIQSSKKLDMEKSPSDNWILIK